MTSDTDRHATRMAAGTHRAVVAGLEQSYHVHGTGPTCVVHPGGPGADWRYLRLPALEDQLTLVYVEPIGTGGSARLDDSSDYTLARYADQLQHLIEHLGIAPTHVLGHSHGGFVALTHALAHPDSVAGLILVDTAARAGADWLDDVMQGVGAFAARHHDRDDIADVLAALEEETTATTDDELTAIFRRQFPIYVADYWSREAEFRSARSSAVMYAGPNQADSLSDYDIRERLGSIDAPTLVIAGRHDIVMPVQYSEELHATLPHAQLVVLEHSGHFGHLEETDTFAATVNAFITR